MTTPSYNPPAQPTIVPSTSNNRKPGTLGLGLVVGSIIGSGIFGLPRKA